jgi:hypothetical protein
LHQVLLLTLVLNAFPLNLLFEVSLVPILSTFSLLLLCALFSGLLLSLLLLLQLPLLQVLLLSFHLLGFLLNLSLLSLQIGLVFVFPLLLISTHLLDIVRLPFSQLILLLLDCVLSMNVLVLILRLALTLHVLVSFQVVSSLLPSLLLGLLLAL